MEIWKNLEFTNNEYLISSYGRVKSLKYNKEKILKPLYNAKGYERIDLRYNNKRKSISIHQLVAIAFLNHKPNGMNLIIDHIDGNIKNNNVNNLQIITNGENVRKQKKRKLSTSNFVGVSFCKLTNKWRSQIQINKQKKYLGVYDSQLEAFNAYEKYKNEQTTLNFENYV